MTHALDYYEETPQVFMVSGFMYYTRFPSHFKTFFLPSSFIWGWGTWQRAWQHFSWAPTGWEAFACDKKAHYEYDYFGAIGFSKLLRESITGHVSAWDAQWMYSMYQKGGLGLHPHRSLTWNCGVGGGTHGTENVDNDPMHSKREYYIHGRRELSDFATPQLSQHIYSGRAFPEKVCINKEAMHLLAHTFLQQRWRNGERKEKIIFKMIKNSLLLPVSF